MAISGIGGIVGQAPEVPEVQSGLDVGVSEIAGGTNGEVLYDNNGVLGEYNNTQLTAQINVFTSTLSGAAPASGGGTDNYLRADGTWDIPPGGSYANPTGTVGLTVVDGTATTAMRSDAAPPLSQSIQPTWTSPHTWTGTGPQLTIGANSGNIGQIALLGSTSGTITIQPQAAAGTYNFNLPTTAGTSGYYLTSGGGSGSPMTWTEPVGVFTSSANGLVPASGGGTTNFLRADGTWDAPPTTSPGGSSGQVQYNSSGSFAGSSNLTFSSNTLSTSYLSVTDGDFYVSTNGVIAPKYTAQSLTASGGTLTIDLSQGNIVVITMTANTTIAYSNINPGFWTFIVKQNATGGYTLTWNSSTMFVAGQTPAQTTSANAIDIYSFISDGTYLYGSFVPNMVAI